MSKQNKHTSKKMINALDLPKDLFLGLPNISMCGNEEFYISNHRGILSYSQEEIDVLTKECQIQIKGRGLVIYAYSKDELTIHGYIQSVVFL